MNKKAMHKLWIIYRNDERWRESKRLYRQYCDSGGIHSESALHMHQQGKLYARHVIKDRCVQRIGAQ